MAAAATAALWVGSDPKEQQPVQWLGWQVNPSLPAALGQATEKLQVGGAGEGREEPQRAGESTGAVLGKPQGAGRRPRMGGWILTF